VRTAIGDLTPTVGVRAACEAFNFPRASFCRKVFGPVLPPSAVVRNVPRALASTERETVLACLHEERFQNSAPAAVYATLLDQGRYHCSIRTMYRILESEGEARERRDQLVHPAYTKPELLATGPNQLWSCVNDLQTGCIPDGRSGDYQDPQPSPCFRRQSVFGKPFPDFEVSARFSGALWIVAGCSFFLSGFLRLLQPRASPFRPGASLSGRGASRLSA
jgi:hypothetical protein